MKKLILAFLFSLVTFVGINADEITPPFPLTSNPIIGGNNGSGQPGYSGGSDGDEGEVPVKGNRAPTRPVYCSIDFDAAEVKITGYDCADIETFEIRDEDAVSCLYITDNCTEFVSELAKTQGTVYVIFYFDGFTLSGYFSR